MNHATAIPAGPAPTANRVRVEGVLDRVRASDGTLTLRLDNGQELCGELASANMHNFVRLLGRRVLLFGNGTIDDGKLVFIDADGFLPADGKPFLVSPPIPPATPDEQEEMTRRLKSIVGQWPGTESESEIERALREMS